METKIRKLVETKTFRNSLGEKLGEFRYWTIETWRDGVLVGACYPAPELIWESTPPNNHYSCPADHRINR